MEIDSTHSDISRGVETMPIAADQSVNMADIADFVYVRHNIPGPSQSHKAFEDTFDGCGCVGKPFCDDCECVNRFGKMYDDSSRLVSVDPFSQSMKPIYECNKSCRCNKTCHNRVVQYGIPFELCVMRTEERGYGVKCLEDLPKNAFVCEYAGEMLTLETARLRTKNLRKNEPNYILTLTEHNAEGVLRTHVDPSFIGNVGRFINHSCEPNMYMVPVRVDNDVPHLAMFTIRDLKQGEELTYDYSGLVHSGDDTANGEPTTMDPDIQVEGTRCLCRSAKCRKYLPFEEVLFTKS